MKFLTILFLMITATANAQTMGYFECGFWLGNAQKAKIILDHHTIGAAILLASEAPYSYLDGREGDTIALMTNADATQLTLDMSSDSFNSPAITAVLAQSAHAQNKYAIKLFVAQNNAVDLSVGSCLRLMK